MLFWKITYGMSDNVEKLVLVGNTAIDAIGNELNNTISGIGSHLGVPVVSFECASMRDCRRMGARSA